MYDFKYYSRRLPLGQPRFPTNPKREFLQNLSDLHKNCSLPIHAAIRPAEREKLTADAWAECVPPSLSAGGGKTAEIKESTIDKKVTVFLYLQK